MISPPVEAAMGETLASASNDTEVKSNPPTSAHLEKTMPTIVRTGSYRDEEHVHLGWRSWVVVSIAGFACVFLYLFSYYIILGVHVKQTDGDSSSRTGAQVFVVVAASSVIAFIVRDLGNPSLSGWIIQGPLLMQSVLSPIIGRLSDVLDRKYLSAIPPLIAFIGAVISAKATSMSMLIGGGILIGVTLSTIAIVGAIPSEVLPLKYRAIANGIEFFAGAVGSLIGLLSAGSLTNANTTGWRSIFWIQAAFHLFTSFGLLAFYWPPRRSDFPKMAMKAYVWACDPVGSLLFVSSATLMLLALDWVGGAYPWHDPHVAVPLSVGLGLLLAFCLYEWKGRTDGLVAHVYFQNGPNFGLSVFAFAVEGWIYYSAVNSITPQIILNLGFETTAWKISIRQMALQVPALVAWIPISYYSTRFKDFKSPLVATFTLFLIVTICYATITPSKNHAQIGYNIIVGIGITGPLTLLVGLVQFCAPHAYLSTATGLAFSARAIGGAFGSAILDAIISGRLASDYSPAVSSAAESAGLPASSVSSLLAAFAAGSPQAFEGVPGLNATILEIATEASREVYAHAYRLAWSSIIPFVALAVGAILAMRGVGVLMTEHVEATVEKVGRGKEEEVGAG